MSNFNRRDFIMTSLIGGVGVTCFDRKKIIAPFMAPGDSPTRVSLSTGNNRADLAFRALQPFSKEIKHAIGNRMVVAMGPPSVFSRNSQFHLLLRLFLYLA